MRQLPPVTLSVLLLLLCIPGWSQDERLFFLGDNPVIHAEPVQVRRGVTGDVRVGQLTFLGGVRLTSPDRSFGGFSALLVQGQKVTLLSDGGSVARFSIDSQWHVSGASFGILPGGPGTGWRKRDRDSESITLDPATGQMWVGFEDSNQIWRYSPGLAWAEGHSAPPAMAKWDRNGGAEAMVRLADGRFAVFSETTHGRKGVGRASILFSGDPVAAPRRGLRFSYLPPADYDPSDVAALPDGRLLVLNRQFALPFNFSAKLTIVDPRRIRRGKMVRGRDIAILAAPLLHDNFEGLAVTRENGATILWIVSDDNLSLLQQTLLLKFRLEPDDPMPK